MKINSIHRRTLVKVIGGSIFLGKNTCNATSLPAPPTPTLEDYVLRANLIFVGKVERFIFRGTDLLILPEEYGKEFGNDNQMGNRALIAVVRLMLILWNDLEFTPENPSLVQAPFPRENYEANLGKLALFLVAKGTQLDANNRANCIYRPVTNALSVEYESSVQEFIDNRKLIRSP